MYLYERILIMCHSEKYWLSISISLLLTEGGINPNSLGHLYLQDALFLTFQNKELLSCITKELYPLLAQKHMTSTSGIEHSIRHSIHTAYLKQESPLSKLIFAYGRPSNSEFLSILLEYLNNRKR